MGSQGSLVSISPNARQYVGAGSKEELLSPGHRDGTY